MFSTAFHQAIRVVQLVGSIVGSSPRRWDAMQFNWDRGKKPSLGLKSFPAVELVVLPDAPGKLVALLVDGSVFVVDVTGQ